MAVSFGPFPKSKKLTERERISDSLSLVFWGGMYLLDLEKPRAPYVDNTIYELDSPVWKELERLQEAGAITFKMLTRSSYRVSDPDPFKGRRVLEKGEAGGRLKYLVINSKSTNHENRRMASVVVKDGKKLYALTQKLRDKRHERDKLRSV